MKTRSPSAQAVDIRAHAALEASVARSRPSRGRSLARPHGPDKNWLQICPVLHANEPCRDTPAYALQPADGPVCIPSDDSAKRRLLVRESCL